MQDEMRAAQKLINTVIDFKDGSGFGEFRHPKRYFKMPRAGARGASL
jgi:hypothetical protein